MKSNNVDRPIRILHVLGGLNFGGAETMVMNLYRVMDRTQIQFDFAIHVPEKCDYEDEVLSLGGKIYRFPKFGGYNAIQYATKWKRFFQDHEEYQIVHGHMRSTASIYLLIAKKQGRYTISHSHNTSNGNGVAAFVKNVLQFPIKYIADAFFACSKVAGEWLFGKRTCRSENFYVIPNAVDLDKFRYNEQIRRKVRERLGLSDKWVIGNIARFHEQKNHRFMIELFDLLIKDESEAILVLVGEGDTKTEIQKLVDWKGLRDKVLFLPPTQNVDALMQAFDIFILPSQYEGFGMVSVEAQIAGLPVVCSERVPKEINLTGKVHFIKLEDVQSWKYVILNEKAYMREQTEDTVFSKYDIQKTANWITNFYKEAVSR